MDSRVLLTCLTCRVGFHDSDLQRDHYKSEWHRYNLKRKIHDLPPVTAENFQERVEERVEEPEEDSQASVVKADSEDEDWEEIEGTPIPINICLFCEKESPDINKNLKHMSVSHSFFIPDAEYCIDIEGLVEYLGEKVGQGMVCLWCSDRSRQFYSVQAAQQHMRDKGHCRILHEDESVFEFTDFYDYSSSYPDDAEDKNNDELYQPDPVFFNENMQLVLPSGVTLGHRALKLYYRQYVRPNSQLVQSRQSKRSKLLQQYKAIGYGEISMSAAQQKSRDQKYFKLVRDKYRMKLGVKGNKILQTHFRRQVQF